MFRFVFWVAEGAFVVLNFYCQKSFFIVHKNVRSKFRIIVGCFAVVSVANFCHAEYPSIGNVLRHRLTYDGFSVDLFDENEVEKVEKRIVPEVFKKPVDRMKQATSAEKSVLLTPLGIGK